MVYASASTKSDLAPGAIPSTGFGFGYFQNKSPSPANSDFIFFGSFNYSTLFINSFKEQIMEIEENENLKCTQDNKKIISKKLFESRLPNENHFDCIDWLIENLEIMRQLICNCDILMKTFLVNLVDKEGLLILELKHPSVLQISLVFLNYN